MIYNINVFKDLLSNYFKTRNYSSFVRQLNFYNFRKLKNASGNPEYRHPRFIKGDVGNLEYIKRDATKCSKKTVKKRSKKYDYFYVDEDLNTKLNKIDKLARIAMIQSNRLCNINKKILAQLKNVNYNSNRNLAHALTNLNGNTRKIESDGLNNIEINIDHKNAHLNYSSPNIIYQSMKNNTLVLDKNIQVLQKKSIISLEEEGPYSNKSFEDNSLKQENNIFPTGSFFDDTSCKINDLKSLSSEFMCDFRKEDKQQPDLCNYYPKFGRLNYNKTNSMIETKSFSDDIRIHEINQEIIESPVLDRYHHLD